MKSHTVRPQPCLAHYLISDTGQQWIYGQKHKREARIKQDFPAGSQPYVGGEESDSEMIFFAFNNLKQSFLPRISDHFWNPCQMLVSKTSMVQNSFTTCRAINFWLALRMSPAHSTSYPHIRILLLWSISCIFTVHLLLITQLSYHLCCENKSVFGEPLRLPQKNL